MTDLQRIRHKPGTVLDQVETRNYLWNPDTLEYEPATTEIQQTLDPVAHYKFSDNTAPGDPQFLGYVDKDQNWYIMKLTSSGARFANGVGNYATNWGNRESLTYYYFFELNW